MHESTWTAAKCLPTAATSFATTLQASLLPVRLSLPMLDSTCPCSICTFLPKCANGWQMVSIMFATLHLCLHADTCSSKRSSFLFMCVLMLRSFGGFTNKTNGSVEAERSTMISQVIAHLSRSFVWMLCLHRPVSGVNGDIFQLNAYFGGRGL